MKAEHLYVVAFHNGIGSESSKRHETQKSAEALYERHRHKCGNAVLVEVEPFMESFEFKRATSNQLPVPSELADKLPSVAPRAASSTDASSSNATSNQYTTRIGVYFVFHADDEGHSIAPSHFVKFFNAVVHKDRLRDVQKISLIACNIARQQTSYKADLEYNNENFDKIIRRCGPNLDTANVSTMFALMGVLRATGINPAICGYDTGVFLGYGPLNDAGTRRLKKDGKPTNDIQRYDQAKGAWVTVEDPVVDGRKLVTKESGTSSRSNTTLVSIKDMMHVNNEYREKNKRVLRIDESGRIAFGLAGWSSN